MVAIKSSQEASAKWARRAGSASGEYEQGVKTPRRSWAGATSAAGAAYEAGVQAAITRKAFQNGVKNAGDAKWQKNAVEKGPARYTQGVALAQEDYEKGFQPYRQALSALVLPARKAKGDASNITRVALVAKTLHDVKMQIQGK